MTEQGEVVRVEGRTAHVLFKRTSACGRCGACGMLSGEAETVVEVPNTLSAQVGQYVELELSGANVLWASAIAYLIPLALLVAGAVAGGALSGFFPLVQADMLRAVCALLGTAIGFAAVWLLNPLVSRSGKFEPRMQSIRGTHNSDESQGDHP
ncbi:MAG: SoxR reducing system RseC family protein [Christensenellales bacterium]|jgi:sigma-E factor negative regulatory protein RseC